MTGAYRGTGTKTREGARQMTRRKWFRVYHGLTSDMSLAVAAPHADITRNDMTALWLYLLDHASRAASCGSIADIDHDEAALALGLTTLHVKNALAVLTKRKKIDTHQRITGWDKHQPTSSHRVRALRARRKNPPPAPQPPRTLPVDHDSPAAIAARRARLQQNNALIIGQPLHDK